MKELDAFTAGWNAAMRLEDHEWGPEPPNTPQTAKRVWEQTCTDGHVIRVSRCPACALMTVGAPQEEP